jgi:hypothetical protein
MKLGLPVREIFLTHLTFSLRSFSQASLNYCRMVAFSGRNSTRVCDFQDTINYKATDT